MKKITTLLIAFVLGLFAVSTAQTALDPNNTVNTQITGPGVYTVEAGQFYAFDGRIDLTFDVTIMGPDSGWVMGAADLPVLVNTPAMDGTARDFFQINSGGSLTLKNVLFSGTHSNGEISGTFAANTGGSKMIADNCVFTDFTNFALRNQFKGDTISITNCVFINGVRLSNSPWGGFPLRMDVACDNVIIENNSVVNSGRLTGNSGPWHNANVHEMHNTYLNQTVNGHEQRANEMITANNIFYNYHIRGRKNENSMNPNNTYDAHFTTWNYFADSKNSLDSISLYLGQNLFYREQAILDWYASVPGDSMSPSLLWEHPDVDSFIIDDDNYTIGTNYADTDPGFTMNPTQTDSIVKYLDFHWGINAPAEWPDWRITPPVSFDGGGQPALSWPPAFDLSYANTYMQTAGTDSLPLGDLNWFPDKKAEFLADRDAIITSIRDSMVNATAVYDPETMDTTPLITPWTTAIEDVLPEQIFALSNYPNPFDQSTTIEFGLLQPAKVTLSVSNLFGQKVFELTEDVLPAGDHEFKFDASDLSSGIYIYTINATGIDGQNYVASKRMILSK